MDVVIAANLPYYITTPILFKIFESNADIAAITVMMQKEVADRFHAKVKMCIRDRILSGRTILTQLF